MKKKYIAGEAFWINGKFYNQGDEVEFTEAEYKSYTTPDAETGKVRLKLTEAPKTETK